MIKLAYRKPWFVGANGLETVDSTRQAALAVKPQELVDVSC